MYYVAPNIPFPLVCDIGPSFEKNRATKTYKIRREGDDDNFKQLYRFSRENVGFLARTFLPNYEETRGEAFQNMQKMKCFLRYVGDPGFQVGVGEDLGLHQTTVCKTVWQTCRAIVEKSHGWIKKYEFPYCIGALDCTHVLIKRPHHFADEFVNRKGLTSFNVQATCNGREMFTSVECRWPGSVHDARIWRNSAIREILSDNNSDAVMLADEAYPIAPWLMTPFKNPSSAEQRSYNIMHTRERVIIERVFGQAKQRFPILQSKIRISTERVPQMVVACFVLHNVAKIMNDEDFTLPEELLQPNYVQFNGGVDDGNSICHRGQRRRDAIAMHIKNQL
ncbi:putative nuclease HARBI1 [Toxorhynchites rutilus septentrionalis]|uniref:putative nuclease HARBI1 n=1 Tax=Toxorhynchites rutilus septentrionalis TaxID=329112 RepID=UPI00247B257B|nr:putative nuclease HARBI1 [Toxorhynchites rutilus septentrionalis]